MQNQSQLRLLWLHQNREIKVQLVLEGTYRKSPCIGSEILFSRCSGPTTVVRLGPDRFGQVICRFISEKYLLFNRPLQNNLKN